MSQGFTSTLRKIITNPAWASVLVAIVAVTVTIVIYRLESSKSHNELVDNKVMVYSTTDKTLTDFPSAVAGRTRILIDGKDEKDVKFYEYIIDYRGNHPLRAADFETPIRGSVPQNRKILAIQQSKTSASVLSMPTRIDKSGHVQQEVEGQINCEVQVVDQRNFEIKPMLINPDEWFRVEIYTSAVAPNDKPSKSTANDADKDEKTAAKVPDPEITWSCRIAGVKCPAERDYVSLVASLNTSSSDPFNASISYYVGWSVYFIVIFTVVNLTLLVVLAKQTRLRRARSEVQIILFAFAVFLSMAVSEMLADRLFNDVNLTDQPVVLLYADIVVFFFLVGWALSSRSNASRE